MDIFWLEAEPWNDATGQSVFVRACNADLSIATRLWDVEWMPVIDGGPLFSTTVFSGAFTGSTDSSRGQLSLVTGLPDIDDWAALVWPSRPVRIWGGELDLSIPHMPRLTRVDQLFNGLAESFDPDEATLFLRNLLPNGLVASETFKGTGGLEGSPSMANTKKPLSLGQHRNRAPVLLNSGKLLFVCNAAGSLEGIDAVREAGRKLDQPFVYQSTFDALNNATVPATEIHVHLASGAFRLGFEPAGDITADFRGKPRGGTYPTTPVSIAYCLLTAAGWPQSNIDLTSTNAINAAVGYPAQFHDDGSTDVADALTALFAGCGGYWDVDQLGIFYGGLVQIGNVEDFTVGDEGLAQFDILETDFLPTRAPFYRNRVGYLFNSSVMSYADTSAGASPEQLALLESIADLVDGTVTVFFQSTAPTTAADRDLWHDSDDGKWYRRENGSWNPTTGLGALGEALAAAAGAQAAADGKVALFYSDSQPTAPEDGDLWVKPGEAPRTFRTWSGGAWTPVSTLGADLSTNIIDTGSGSTAIVPRGEIRTPLGTAAAVVGQGPGATADRNVIYNDQIKIGANGGLIGGGGGSVTYTGLGGGALGLLQSLFFGSNLLLESSGGSVATLNAFKTALGIASGFVNQGIFATAGALGRNSLFNGFFNADTFGLNDVLTRADGSKLTELLAVTPLGTAAAIASQGAFATLNSAGYGSSLLTGFGALSPLSNLAFGSSYLLESSGGASASLANFKTALGIASGFTGQGAFSTLSQIDLTNTDRFTFGGRFAPIPNGDSRYFSASNMVYVESNTIVANLRPQEAGSNVTENRSAASFVGQGAFATQSYLSLDAAAYFNMPDRIATYRYDTIGALSPYYVGGTQGIAARLTDVYPGEFNANKTEGRTAAAIVGQNWGATAPRINVDNAYVPLGVNAQIDSAFSRGRATWKLDPANMPSPNLEFNRSDYSGKRSVAYLWSPASSVAAGTYCDAVGLGAWAGGTADQMRKFNLPVKLGDVVGVRILAGNHRCDAQLYLLLFDKDGKLVTAPSTYQGSIAGGGVGGDNLGTMQFAVTIQDGSIAYAELMMRMICNSANGNPYVFFSEPWIGKLASINAPFPAFAHGPSDPTSDRTNDNTAAGFTGQSPWATYTNMNPNTVYGQVQYLQGDGHATGDLIYDKFGAGTLTDVYPGQRGANVTEGRTAAAIVGQSGFATNSGLTRDRLFSQGFFNFNAFSLNYTVTRQDGSSIVTESLAITQLGIAAGFSGQGGLATRDQADTPQIAPGAVSSFQGVNFGITTANAGEQADSDQRVSFYTTGGRLRVEVSADTVRTGTGTNIGYLQIMVQQPDGSVIQIGRQVKALSVVDGPPVYYVAYVTLNAGTYQFFARLSVGTGKGSNQWNVPSGFLGVEESKR